ncbi:MAG: MerR family transcriptional regulator [Burkholderiaceae bacterium]
MSPERPSYLIGQVATLSGVTPANIRFYERSGLLPKGQRGTNSYRRYDERDIHQLRFIRLCRAMDMSLDEVRTLLALDLSNKEDCQVANVALDEHILHVEERMRELGDLQRDLVELRSRCDGSGSQCRIIEALHARAESQPREAPIARGHRHV